MEMTAAGSSRKMRSKSAVVVLHMGAAITAAAAATPPNGSTKIRKPNSWLTSLFLCLSQISLKSLGLSLSLKCPSNLSSSSVLGFVAGGKRSKILWGNFQDLEVFFLAVGKSLTWMLHFVILKWVCLDLGMMMVVDLLRSACWRSFSLVPKSITKLTVFSAWVCFSPCFLSHVELSCTSGSQVQFLYEQ